MMRRPGLESDTVMKSLLPLLSPFPSFLPSFFFLLSSLSPSSHPSIILLYLAPLFLSLALLSSLYFLFLLLRLSLLPFSLLLLLFLTLSLLSSMLGFFRSPPFSHCLLPFSIVLVFSLTHSFTRFSLRQLSFFCLAVLIVIPFFILPSPAPLPSRPSPVT